MIFKKGRPILIPSKNYLEFERECLKLIPSKYKKEIDYPVNIKAVFYTESKRKIDITNLLSALDDMLIKANVIQDDCRDIVASHDGSLVFWDKDNPRIEIEITKKENYKKWKE